MRIELTAKMRGLRAALPAGSGLTGIFPVPMCTDCERKMNDMIDDTLVERVVTPCGACGVEPVNAWKGSTTAGVRIVDLERPGLASV